MKYSLEYNGLWFQIRDTSSNEVICETWKEEHGRLIVNGLNYVDGSKQILIELEEAGQREQDKQDE